METREIITKLLEVTEERTDGVRYLEFFRSLEPWKFGLVYPTAESIYESWNLLLYDLKVLHSLELYPVVYLHSSIPSYIKTFLYQGITDSEHKNTEKFVPMQLIRMSGDLKSKVVQCISDHKIPIILNEEDETNGFEKISEVLRILESNKLIILNSNSGIRKRNDAGNYSIISLQRDFDKLIHDSGLGKNDSKLLTFIKDIFLLNNKLKFTVSITSPALLLKELFTVKGSGTLVKRGSQIHILDSLDQVEMPKLKNLVEASFRKAIKPNFFDQKIVKIILESEYKACALMVATPIGILLSKFAVDEIARGEGIGRDIWDRMREIYPNFFWRAKKYNSITKWYAKEADGLHKTGDWVYYWIGEKPERISEIIHYLENLPEDLVSIS
ncbi:acetylglutamate kinase [Leptospira sp. GIMC2001]|uniref:acetylglutamate kinase n=1 Tax=Leptospira sp. GIMC2001 TaxID=1513297 RepID=UPI00234B6DA5|nr:acetylglutamate kinase [Leptospira sp. GIMC2001]WCL47956.1 acetylglutamate kinase [Leptospira sp. GIMC2001]